MAVENSSSHMKWDVGFSWNCRRLTLNGGGGMRRCWSERIDKANRKLLWFDFSIHFPASSRMMWHPTTRQINRDYSTQLNFFSLTFFLLFFRQHFAIFNFIATINELDIEVSSSLLLFSISTSIVVTEGRTSSLSLNDAEQEEKKLLRNIEMRNSRLMNNAWIFT